MTVFTYSRVPAFNPNTNPASVAKSASGSVYDPGDVGFLTPLNLTLVATNTVTTSLFSDANGMFPDFTLDGRTQCVFRSGTQAFVLTTTTPVPGPTGPVSTVPGPPGPATTDASLLAAGTVADARLPSRLQDAALNATYVPRASSGSESRIEDVNAMKIGTRTATTWVTPDGTGVVVHPSVLFFPNGFNGYRWWAAITPYFNSNSAVENPIIQVSKDGTTWVTPPGVTNPLVGQHAGGYNSDTHLIQHPQTGEFLLYYRDYSTYPDALNENIMLMRSANGITWSAPVRVLSLSESVKRLMCPVVWWSPAENKWVMLGVEIIAQPRNIERYTAADPAGPFVFDRIVTLGQAWPATTSPWHFDAKPVGSQIVSLMQTTVANGSDGATWLMVSDDDGKTFTRATDPLVASGTYRPCFVPRITERGLALDTFIGGAPSSWGVTRGVTSVPAVVVPPVVASESETILAARAGLPPWLIADAFARADNAGLGNADTGQAWTSSSGTFKIAGKAATPTAAANTRSYVETGVVDHWPTHQVASDMNAGEAWLIARLVDASNYYRASLYPTSVVLQAIVAGSVTVLNTTTIPAVTAGATLGLRCVGSTIQVYVNGSVVATVTDSTHAGTKAGMQANLTAAMIRNFRVRTP